VTDKFWGEDLPWFRAFRDASRWQVATSMPHIPHCYTSHRWHDRPEFERAVQIVRDYGYKRAFQGSTYTYWSMGWPVPQTEVLNRAVAPPAYHTSLSGRHKVTAPALPAFKAYGNVALTHDMTLGFPSAMERCDVLYAEPPWPVGYNEFAERAPVSGGFEDFMAAMGHGLLSADKPAVIIGGKLYRKHLPEATREVPCRLDGANVDAVAYVYGDVECPSLDATNPHTAFIIADLAQHYQCVGDFCCGFGKTAHAFADAGKNFVVSDSNPECIGYIAMQSGWAIHPDSPL
jgi:hypothetical protein